LSRRLNVSQGGISRAVRDRSQWVTRAWMALLFLGLSVASPAGSQTAQPPASNASSTKTAKPANTHASTVATRTENSAAAPVKTYGSSTAPITMEVFTDYECPSCRNLFEQTLRPMIADYVANGKVRLVHHDFPLPPPGHHYSGQAARWANAAARVGEFAAVESALYDNQPALEANGSLEKFVAAAMSAEDFKRVEKQMQGCVAPGPTSNPSGGINLAPSRGACSLDAYIEQDIMLGEKVPVTATPTYVITYKGNRLPAGSGQVSWPILKQFFDSLLGQ
jgi:protein-disulfide isomerase